MLTGAVGESTAPLPRMLPQRFTAYPDGVYRLELNEELYDGVRSLMSRARNPTQPSPQSHAFKSAIPLSQVRNPTQSSPQSH
jgi:hypothetical protein